jgi:hypothetical protein
VSGGDAPGWQELANDSPPPQVSSRHESSVPRLPRLILANGCSGRSGNDLHTGFGSRHTRIHARRRIVLRATEVDT